MIVVDNKHLVNTLLQARFLDDENRDVYYQSPTLQGKVKVKQIKDYIIY